MENTFKMEESNMFVGWEVVQSTDSVQFLSKISMAFFIELEQRTLKFVWKHSGPWTAKTILRKENKAWSIIFPGFRLY